MNRKTIMAMLLLSVLMFSAVSFADEEELDGETSAEIGVMVNAIGAEYRFLQLERAVTQNILHGAKVLEVIEANHPEEDISGLQAILDEMEVLLEEIQGVDTEGDLNELAVLFVEYKKDSIDLSRQFRELVAEIITADDRAELAGQIREIRSAVLDDLKEAKEEARRAFNAERVRLMLENMGVSDGNFLNQVLSGEADLNRVRQRLMDRFSNLGDENKVKALQRIRENASKRKVLSASVVANAAKNYKVRVLERKAERTEARAEKLLQKAESARDGGFEARANRLEAQSNALGNRVQAVSAVARNVREAQGGPQR